MNQPQEKVTEGIDAKAKPAKGTAAELQAQFQAMKGDKAPRKKALQARFSPAQGARNIHRYIMPREDQLADLLENDYWGHVQARFNINDRIEVNPDDGSFYAELMVRSTTFGYVVTAVINFVEFDGPVSSLTVPEEYLIKFDGPYLKWLVKRFDKVMVEKLETKDLAQKWLKNHLRDLRVD